MLEAYSSNLSVTPNSTIQFNNRQLLKDFSTTLSGSGTEINLNRAGVFQIDFDCVGQSTATGTVGVQLMNGTTPIASTNSVVDAVAGEDTYIGFSTLVDVSSSLNPTIATVSVQYVGTAGTLSRANIIVKKVG